MALSNASIEACNVFSALNCLDSSFTELKVASVSAVIQERQVGVDFETL